MELEKLPNTCSIYYLSDVSIHDLNLVKENPKAFAREIMGRISRMNLLEHKHQIMYTTNADWSYRRALKRIGFRTKHSYKGYDGKAYIMIAPYIKVYNKAFEL